MSNVRLATWNIRDLTGNPMAVRRVLIDLKADVVCLQEAPRRPGGVHWRTAPLARSAGLRHVIGGRLGGGTAILVGPRVEVLARVERRLPVPNWYTRRRGVSVAVLRMTDQAGVGRGNGLTLAVASVHLPLMPTERVQHARLVRQLLDDSAATAGLVRSGRVAIAGDLNEEPGSPAWRAFGTDLRDCAGASDGGGRPTFPARGPSRRIDAILTGSALAVPENDVPNLPPGLVQKASDHLPVLAVLTAD